MDDRFSDVHLASVLATAIRKAVRDDMPGQGVIPVAMLRYAVVMVASPLEIQLGGDQQAAKALSSYTPVVNDIVAVLQPTEGAVLVLGKVV